MKLKRGLSLLQMKQISKLKNENVYYDYIHTLTCQNEQYHIERQVMEKEILDLRRQLDISTNEKESIRTQFQLNCQLCQQKDKTIQEMQKNQSETSKLLKQQNEEILKVYNHLKSEQVRWESQIFNLQKQKNVSKTQNTISTSNIQQKEVKKKKSSIYAAYNYVISFQLQIQAKKLIKKQIEKIETEHAQFRNRTEAIFSTLKIQQDIIAEYLEKLESLAVLLKKKEKEIESLESSNQYLRKLNQSLINQSTQQFNSAISKRSSHKKLLTKPSKELNSTTQEEGNFEMFPQESPKITANKDIKTCNNEAVLASFRLS